MMFDGKCEGSYLFTQWFEQQLKRISEHMNFCHRF